jgi:hypothetical protein
MLARQVLSITYAVPPALFSFSYFSVRQGLTIFCPAWTENTILLISTS